MFYKFIIQEHTAIQLKQLLFMNYCMQPSALEGATECCLFQPNTSQIRNIFRPFEANCGIRRHPMDSSSSKIKGSLMRRTHSQNGQNSSEKKKISITKTNERSRSVHSTTKQFRSFEQTQKKNTNPQKQNQNKNQKLSPDADKPPSTKVNQIKFLKSEEKSHLSTPTSQFHNFYSGKKANKYDGQSLKACSNSKQKVGVHPLSKEIIHQKRLKDPENYSSTNKQILQQNQFNENCSITMASKLKKGKNFQEEKKHIFIQSLDKMNDKSVKSIYENSEIGTKKIEESIILFNYFNPTERKSNEVDIQNMKICFSSHS